jgi:hypothetical protein
MDPVVNIDPLGETQRLDIINRSQRKRSMITKILRQKEIIGMMLLTSLTIV